jgi:hypothetical protein
MSELTETWSCNVVVTLYHTNEQNIAPSLRNMTEQEGQYAYYATLSCVYETIVVLEKQ